MSPPPRVDSRHVLLAAAATLVLACSSRPAPARAPSPTPDDGGATAGATAVSAAARTDAAEDAGSVPDGSLQTAAPDAGPAPLPVSSAVAIVAGEERPLDRAGTTLVDPAAAFRVDLAAQITDGRLALHDAQDAMVASAGSTEVGASSTRFQLAPQEPLRPGTAYTLQLDGAVERDAHDPAGRAYAPVVLQLRTTGEAPAPARKAGKRGRAR